LAAGIPLSLPINLVVFISVKSIPRNKNIILAISTLFSFSAQAKNIRTDSQQDYLPFNTNYVTKCFEHKI